MTTSGQAVRGRISVDRWPTEMPLFMVVLLASIIIWVGLTVSVIGVVYAAFIGLFFFMSRVAFVSYLRGSGVKLGPDQFPSLYGKVQDLARAMDMEPPAAYLMQAGGILNAFATRFLGRDIMVLYSDLLEACGENDGARDMIIAHELAHMRCGHLRWVWFTLPGLAVPFLGSALSRAREYTCDRFGLAGAGNTGDAAVGLAILSAGARFGPDVNLRAFVRQRADMNTGLMTIGEWLMSHPPLSKRVAAIAPDLDRARFHPTRGRVMALVLLLVAAVGSVGSVIGLAMLSATLLDIPEQAAETSASPSVDPEVAAAQVQTDLETLAQFIGSEWTDGAFPETMSELRERWTEVRDEVFPLDPFDGYQYGYRLSNDGYRLWSSGPDGESSTADDIVLLSPPQ